MNICVVYGDSSDRKDKAALYAMLLKNYGNNVDLCPLESSIDSIRKADVVVADLDGIRSKEQVEDGVNTKEIEDLLLNMKPLSTKQVVLTSGFFSGHPTDITYPKNYHHQIITLNSCVMLSYFKDHFKIKKERVLP